MVRGQTGWIESQTEQPTRNRDPSLQDQPGKGPGTSPGGLKALLIWRFALVEAVVYAEGVPWETNHNAPSDCDYNKLTERVLPYGAGSLGKTLRFQRARLRE